MKQTKTTKKQRKETKKKKAKSKGITKKTKFSEIMEKYPELIETLSERGLHCLGCPMAMQESLEQGALAHGMDAEKLVKELNEKLSKGKLSVKKP